MKILKIYKNNSPKLRVKCSLLENLDKDFYNNIKSMKELMIKNKGIGLSAPQVGIPKTYFIMKTLNVGIITIINPKILKESIRCFSSREGCLSFPSIFVSIIRSFEIEVEYINENGEEIKTNFNGLDAQIFQHEYDHLQGILIIDFLEKVNA